MRASVKFLTMRLRGEKADFGGIADDDMGVTQEECRVTETGQVRNLPGFRSAYDYLREELDIVLAARRAMSGGERSVLVRRLADIDESRLRAREVFGKERFGEIRLVRAAYEAEGGYHVPAVELVPADVKGAPVLLVGDDFRSNRLAAAQGFLKDGCPVMLADVFATGEIGGTHHHYNNPHDDEETAKMLYLVGSSLVGRRAGEIIALARDLKARYGKVPSVVAQGRTAVAAAHACAAASDAVAAVKVVDAPLAWAEAVRTRAFYDYAAAVHGGLLHYDWIDLLE